MKLPVKRKTVLWVAAAAVGTLVLLAIGLGVGLSQTGWQKDAPRTGAVSAISQICANIGR